MSSGEGKRVRVLRPVGCLQLFWYWVTTVVWGRHTFASADSQEQVVEDHPHCFTSDGETAIQSDATSSGDKKWKEILPTLAAKSPALRELQFSNIDPTGEYKVPLDIKVMQLIQLADAAAKRESAQCRTLPPRRSLEDSKEQGTIITAQRTPELAFQDVKTEVEVLVMNPCLMKTTNLSDTFNQDYRYVRTPTGADAFYADQFRKFGKSELDNIAAGELAVEAKPSTGPEHVPPSVSEGNVSTFALHVDKTKTTLVPSLEKHRIAAGECAEILASLEQTPPTEKTLQEGNDGSDSLGQGFSSSSSM